MPHHFDKNLEAHHSHDWRKPTLWELLGSNKNLPDITMEEIKSAGLNNETDEWKLDLSDRRWKRKTNDSYFISLWKDGFWWFVLGVVVYLPLKILK